jgi:hypothetical protein
MKSWNCQNFSEKHFTVDLHEKIDEVCNLIWPKHPQHFALASSGYLLHTQELPCSNLACKSAILTEVTAGSPESLNIDTRIVTCSHFTSLPCITYKHCTTQCYLHRWQSSSMKRLYKYIKVTANTTLNRNRGRCIRWALTYEIPDFLSVFSITHQHPWYI